MVTQERDVPALHCMGDALAFSDIKCQPVVPRLDRDAPMESQGILAEQWIDGARFRQRERRGVGHVRVQHDRMTSDPMNRCVNEQSRRFCPMPTLEDLTLAVHEQDVIGTDLAPVQAARVEQEPIAIHCHAINRFIRLEPNRGATVATPAREEIVAQFRIREVISGLGARAAAERIAMPGHRAKVEALLNEIEDQTARNTEVHHRKENGRFHRAINEMSGIPDIGDLLDQFNFPILHTIYFRDLSHEHWMRNMSDHLDIARAVLHGDAIAAEHFARQHMHRMVDIAVTIAEQLGKDARRAARGTQRRSATPAPHSSG